MDDTIFLKKTADGKFIKVKEAVDADYVRQPIGDYVPVEEWNTMVDQYMLLKAQISEIWENDPVADDKSYVISKSEYHGLQNCLRILRDRALQQIDKEHADPQGYTLKFADQRVYDRVHPEQKAYLISKTTPVSLKIDLETASFLIKKDLGSFYNYIDLTSVITRSYRNPSKIKIQDLLIAISQRDDPRYTHNFYVENSDNGKKIKEYLDNAPSNLIFNIARISANQGQGVYEVSYWATGLI